MNGKSYIFKGARVIDPARGVDAVMDIGVAEGRVVDPGQIANPEVVDLSGKILSPGFIDLHVHLRQPGNNMAETIASGTAAAAAGGFTSIVAMPNTNPPADTAGAIEFLRQTAAQKGVVHVLPCGCMTKNYEGREMAGIGSLKAAGVVALSDDGRCIQDHSLMRHVVEYAKSFNLPILDHCEEKTLAADGVMNEGKWSVLLGMNGISGASEELMVARNIILARQIGWKIHMQHVSVKESVELLRNARAKGIPVSGEATPHHLTLTDECIKTYSTNYKMNPPLRSEEDRLALIEGVADGTITVIATDHAPHTRTAKLVEFDYAPFGIIGLETALPLCYTELVAKGVIDLAALVKLFHDRPRRSARHRKLQSGRRTSRRHCDFRSGPQIHHRCRQIQVEFAQHAVQRARSRVQGLGHAGQRENGLLRRMKTLADILPGIIEFRHALHRIPEMAGQEFKTSQLIRERLAVLGLEVLPPFLGTDVVALLYGGRGAGRNVTLRADIDALALEEATGRPYRSTHPGHMHACGHDGHAAMVTGAAELLVSRRDEFAGSVRFVFQPGEENRAMGRELVAAGVLENPAADVVTALHGMPGLPIGTLATRTGAIMASCAHFKVVLRGKGGHSSRPALSRNPVTAAAAPATTWWRPPAWPRICPASPGRSTPLSASLCAGWRRPPTTCRYTTASCTWNCTGAP